MGGGLGPSVDHRHQRLAIDESDPLLIGSKGQVGHLGLGYLQQSSAKHLLSAFQRPRRAARNERRRSRQRIGSSRDAVHKIDDVHTPKKRNPFINSRRDEILERGDESSGSNERR